MSVCLSFPLSVCLSLLRSVCRWCVQGVVSQHAKRIPRFRRLITKTPATGDDDAAAAARTRAMREMFVRSLASYSSFCLFFPYIIMSHEIMYGMKLTSISISSYSRRRYLGPICATNTHTHRQIDCQINRQTERQRVW